MMPEAVTIVAKGRILAGVDRHLRVPTQAALEGLKLDMPLTDRGRDPDVGVLTTDDKTHADNDWFGGNWWKDFQDKETIVKQAYIKALELSLAHKTPKPIVTYWISGLNTFEAAIGESDQQITVFLVTPPHPPAKLPPPSASFVEQLWVIGRQERIAEICEGYPKSYSIQHHVTDTHAPNIKCVRVVGY